MGKLMTAVTKKITDSYDGRNLKKFLEINGDKIQGDDKMDNKTLQRLELAINDHRNNKTYQYSFAESDYYLSQLQETKFKTLVDEMIESGEFEVDTKKVSPKTWYKIKNNPYYT